MSQNELKNVNTDGAVGIKYGLVMYGTSVWCCGGAANGYNPALNNKSKPKPQIYMSRSPLLPCTSYEV